MTRLVRSKSSLSFLFAALVLVLPSPLQATTIYEFGLETTGGGYQPNFTHVFGQAVYDTHPAAIHGDFGGGASDHYLVTDKPATLEFHVDTITNELVRVALRDFSASANPVEVNYQTGKVSSGAPGACGI